MYLLFSFQFLSIPLYLYSKFFIGRQHLVGRLCEQQTLEYGEIPKDRKRESEKSI